MELNNPFSQEIRNLFLYVYSCFKCGRSDRGLELHHIVGRSSNSAFNACPLCVICHGKIGHTEKEEGELFLITLNFLLLSKYQPIEKDYNFLRAYPYLANTWQQNNWKKKYN